MKFYTFNVRYLYSGNISEGFSFCLTAEYLLFRRSRRHFIPRYVNSHPRSAAFICSGKYSQVRPGSRPCFLGFHVQFRKLGHFANTRSLVCDAAASAAERHRGRLLRSGIPKCVLLTQVTWHWATSMGNPNRRPESTD